MSRRPIALVTICAALAAGLSCVSLSPQGGTGSLKLLITDKPFPFEFIEEATVTITRVEVRTGAVDDADADGTDSDGTDSDGTDSDGTQSPFVTIFEDAEGKEFNLLDLRNGKTDLLADADIPAGTYTLMRLIVTAGEVTLTDGRVFPLRVPSGEQTGIKLHFEFTVEADKETVLLLDVDLSRAFSAIPSGRIHDVSTIREFRFHPSLAMRLIKMLESGSISGTVTDGTNPLADVAVTATKDGAEVATAATAADGTYKLTGLLAGTYAINFSLAGYEDVNVPDIAVSTGAETTGVNAILTATAPVP